MIVVDAAVAAKWILEQEDNKDEALHLLTSHLEGEEEIVVPDLMFYEIANTCVTKTRLSTQEASASLQVIFEANLKLYHPASKEVVESGSY